MASPMKDDTAGAVRFARPRTLARRALAAACAASAFVATCGLAQQAQTITGEATLINWWYSATFGTGLYKVGPINATVVRLPFSYQLRPMEGGNLGVNLLLPVTVAAYHLNLNELGQLNPRWSMDLWNGPAYFNTHFITTSYYSSLAFANPEPGRLSVYREYEIGFSFRAGRPVSIMGFGADTLGLGFRFAENVRGLSLYTEFPF
jgi:hypothetical protein